MKKIQISLSNKDLDYLLKFIKTGKKSGRELERAYVLLALHNKRTYDDISSFYYVSNTTIWRTAKSYLDEGLDKTLKDKERSGQPRKYNEKAEAEIIAIACSKCPKGRKRWTIRLLTEHAKKIKGLEKINRETVRLILKKTNISLG